MTVQGPRDGETHTIANIICHYLATGRRVLVTSRGEPALEVSTKIPEEVRPLTVALLASDREGVRQFQASIEAIQHQVSQLNPEQMRRDIATLQGAIARAHTDLVRIDQRIDEIAVAQLSEVEVDGGTASPEARGSRGVWRKTLWWFDDFGDALGTARAAPLRGRSGYRPHGPPDARGTWSMYKPWLRLSMTCCQLTRLRYCMTCFPA